MTPPLRFLQLSTFYPPYSFGGDAMYIYRLAHALGDLGHKVDVVHNVDAYEFYARAELPTGFPDHPNVTRYGLRSRFRRVSPLLTHQLGKAVFQQHQIRAIFDAHAYDVVHYHNISLLGPGILRLEPRRGQFVKLYTAHDHWLICPTHVLWKFDRRPCERPTCLRCVLAARRPPQLWRYTSFLSRGMAHMDAIIAPSQFTARLHAERGFPHPLSTLPYFMDRVDREWQAPGPSPHTRPYFLFVGRLETIKGLHTLIDVWTRAPEDVDLLVAGIGSQEEELRARAAANPRIKFLGLRTPAELGPLYAHALACIVPSLTYEAFGLITIEAFARKTPVVVHHLGPLPEIVRLSGGGLTYRDDAELLEALARLANSSSFRRELGEKGYSAFLQNWTREAHLTRYFDLLHEAAAAKFGRALWDIGHT